MPRKRSDNRVKDVPARPTPVRLTEQPPQALYDNTIQSLETRTLHQPTHHLRSEGVLPFPLRLCSHLMVIPGLIHLEGAMLPPSGLLDYTTLTRENRVEVVDQVGGANLFHLTLGTAAW